MLIHTIMFRTISIQLRPRVALCKLLSIPQTQRIEISINDPRVADTSANAGRLRRRPNSWCLPYHSAHARIAWHQRRFRLNARRQIESHHYSADMEMEEIPRRCGRMANRAHTARDQGEMGYRGEGADRAVERIGYRKRRCSEPTDIRPDFRDYTGQCI
ncbi:uncharacterized protein RAG0_03145 [Rhynchosporium agropyri]|uniref:Uncharacterized protein n=1 Tax=Rhynchosporium agropyri TaxID=914238 RepID=A0A1E1K3F9_9HELO|nr:uncharacterized protein RAG0_03145 [Rhynchosporium agropyri]